jgi:ArsR family transcriptional regulator
MSDENYLKKLESFFLALADKTRLRLLNLMRENEVCVCFLTEVLGESQPKISRHLAYLRNAGIVSARREGKWMHYKIDVPKDFYLEQILRDTLECLQSKDEMQADYNKLASVCCAAEAPVTIVCAPKHKIFVEPHISYEKRDELETFLL